AFFAEPVKSYFANRAKLHYLRIALHKELLNNYLALSSLQIKDKSSSRMYEYMSRHGLRTECYRNALQNELHLFYQLEEANRLNFLQGETINSLLNLSSDLKSMFGIVPLKDENDVFNATSQDFQRIVCTWYHYKLLDPKILKKIAVNRQYKEIMEKGKAYAEKSKHEAQ
ncbi:MAG: hypothetical protein L0287_04980, partial [Anaerolineae bacterium]|nr:hypothetical protein [Anaerolineae bacterium]